MKLIGPEGQPAWGVLHEAVSEVNYRDYDLRSAMDKPRGAIARHFGFNQFTFIGFHGRDVVGGLAIVDLKLVANLFVYVYDFRAGKLMARSWLSPLALGTTISTSPDLGIARFSARGVAATVETASGGHHVSLDGADLHLDLNLHEIDGSEPLRVCSRAGYTGWTFTQKQAAMTLDGVIRWGDTTIRFDPASDRGSRDWSCGYMRRETYWNWACFAGVTTDGHEVGLNLAAGVNETGVTENALWIDGRQVKLDLARFQFDRYDESGSWVVTTSDGLVELTFAPLATRRERLDVFVLASNFRQYCGRFKGRVRAPGEAWVCVDGVAGFVEDHYARW